jgi:hypothetical protein
VSAVSVACAGVKEDSVARLNRRLSIVLSARLFVEVQKFSAMEEGPDKTATWHHLVMAYVLLRRADFYGVRTRCDLVKARQAEEAMQRADKERDLTPEEKEKRVHEIFGI